MAVGWKDFEVPQEFTPAEDGSLVAFLAENVVSAVCIDVGALRRVDTMLVELLLCGAASWAARGLKFQVTGVTGAHEEVFLHLGITADLLERSVAA